MPVDPSILGPSTLGLTTAVGAFNSFLPPLTEVRKTGLDDPSFVADVRTGEVAAVALTVGVGAIISSLTGSPVPTLVSVVAALGLVLMYETTLRADRPLEPKTMEAKA